MAQGIEVVTFTHHVELVYTTGAAAWDFYHRFVPVQSVFNFTARVFTDLYGNGGKDNDTLDRDNNKVSIVGTFLGKK